MDEAGPVGPLDRVVPLGGVLSDRFTVHALNLQYTRERGGLLIGRHQHQEVVQVLGAAGSMFGPQLPSAHLVLVGDVEIGAGLGLAHGCVYYEALTPTCKCYTILEVTAYLTIGEASEALGLTPRKLRHLGIGAVISCDGSRLYDAEGLTLVWLWADVARRFAEDFPAWKARAGVRYCEPEIRAALARRSSAVVMLDPWRGLVRVSTSAPAGAHTIALRPLLARMRELIDQTRAAKPEVWTGREFTETPELLAV